MLYFLLLRLLIYEFVVVIVHKVQSSQSEIPFIHFRVHMWLPFEGSWYPFRVLFQPFSCICTYNLNCLFSKFLVMKDVTSISLHTIFMFHLSSPVTCRHLLKKVNSTSSLFHIILYFARYSYKWSFLFPFFSSLLHKISCCVCSVLFPIPILLITSSSTIYFSIFATITLSSANRSDCSSLLSFYFLPFTFTTSLFCLCIYGIVVKRRYILL